VHAGRTVSSSLAGLTAIALVPVATLAAGAKACTRGHRCAKFGEVMTRLPLLAILAALALAAGATIVGAVPAELRDGHGIHVESARRLDVRQLDVQVSTAALQHPVDVRIPLPSGYADDPQRRYPVLYLFHGTSGRPSDWINFGNAEQTTAGLPMIVVLPDAGFDGDGGGWFTNWFNGGAGGQPMWETFHIDQVVPWRSTPTCEPSPSARAVRSQDCPRAASARSAMPRAIPTCSPRSPRSPADARSIVTRRR
jgi:hypothetical protein